MCGEDERVGTVVARRAGDDVLHRRADLSGYSASATERFHRRTFGHMDLEVTVDDPKAYTKPWTVTLAGWDLLPDEELIEAICDNERDSERLVGK